MSIRSFRRRMTPEWLATNARRRWRDRIYRRFGIQRCYTPSLVMSRPEILVRSLLPFVLAHELLKNPRLTFLQIGAYDGEGDDDLRELVVKHQLRGVLVEPQPAAFARLRKTYRDQPQVTLLQAAIDEQEGLRELYCRRGTATMAASFERQHLRRHGIPDSEIVAQPVVCHTVASALRAAQLDHVELIQIDAEGYDWPLIRSIDFTTLRPAILRFEYRNLSKRDADECLEFLSSHGFRFFIEPRDIIAYRATDADRPMSVDTLSRISA